MVSLLFIVIAIVFGFAVYRRNVSMLTATLVGIVGIVLIIIIGLNWHPIYLSEKTWMWVVGLYLAIASVTPVWILLQPRDYLSSFLLYFMIAAGVIAVIGAVVTGNGQFAVPAMGDATLKGTGVFTTGTAFPALFVTIACGAISGFHSLVSSGTTAKQLDNEKNAKPIGYGSMLIESALGVISLIAVGMVFTKYTAGEFGSPSAAFAAGIATMFTGDTAATAYKTIYALLTLAVSVFALTSLDTATRLSRFMFSELFLKEGEASWKDATGVRKLLCHPLFGTLLMVVIGCVLGGLKLSAIWGLFGSANQLLAGLALMAVATWLGEVGKNNKMLIPGMIFMLVMTIWKLILTVVALFGKVGAGAAAWGDWFQLVFAVAMLILAVILVIEGIQTLGKQKAAKKA
jgi:carbon starvation protein